MNKKQRRIYHGSKISCNERRKEGGEYGNL